VTDAEHPIAAIPGSSGCSRRGGLPGGIYSITSTAPCRPSPKKKASYCGPLVGTAALVTATEQPLVKINEDAASSWFGNLLYKINLETLSLEEARALLRIPKGTGAVPQRDEQRRAPFSGPSPHSFCAAQRNV